MSNLIPTASTCHTLQLPPIEKDDRYNLNVRTGSASTLYNSIVFTHGGLTIGLELQDHTIPEVIDTFQSRINNFKSQEIVNYISGEIFYLKLIEGTWTRAIIPPEDPKPPPRLLHEICAINNCIYLFGGLAIKDTSSSSDGSSGEVPDRSNILQPMNDLWEFNLEKKKWKLIHDGSGWETNPLIPKPRYLHKITQINTLTFISKRGHFGLLIAGGKDSNSKPNYQNVVFDLVDKKYVGEGPDGGSSVNLHLGSREEIGKSFANANDEGNLNINYKNSIIVNVIDEIDHTYHKKTIAGNNSGSNAAPAVAHTATTKEESIIVYAPIVEDASDTVSNPLLSFKVAKTIKNGKVLPTHRKKIKSLPKTDGSKSNSNQTMPFNLRYPTGGLFGKNIVITGFLPGDFDISIFVFNKPTGKWSRLNIFCNHDYGSHRFWGGFAWQSHHKVVLLGNYVTSKTTSSIRFFSSMITVSLPVTNILASSELADYNGKSQHPHKVFKEDGSTTDSSLGEKTSSLEVASTSASSDSDSDNLSRKKTYEEFENDDYDEDENNDEDMFLDEAHIDGGKGPTISFNDYVHYAAPKANFTTIRSVFPPAAVTLGRIAFDRYGDLISDFELVSANGDRIPVSLHVLKERWGRYFIELLARGYVQAVEKFENNQIADAKDLRLSKDSNATTSSHRSKAKSSLSTGGSVSTSDEKSKSSSDAHKERKVATKTQHTFHMSLPVPKSNSPEKDAPQFRLPFQDAASIDGAEVSTTLKLNKLTIEDTSPGQTNEGTDELDVSTPLDERPSPNRLSSAVDPHEQQDFVSPASVPSVVGPTESDNSSITTSVPLVPSNSSLRRDSTSSFQSASSLFTSHLQDIPPQLPLPDEPVPAVPSNPSFRASSRKSSADLSSPRSSLIHTLTILRNIPGSRSPRESPFASPRNSFSGPQMMLSMGGVQDLSSSPIPNLKQQQASIQGGISPQNKSGVGKTSSSPNDPLDLGSGTNSNSSSFDMKRFNNKMEASMTSVDSSPNHSESLSSDSSKKSSDSFKYSDPSKSRARTESTLGTEENEIENSVFDGLLNLEDMENGTFKMEPSLIPRKLYIPFTTVSVKGFCEFLYTGQVGNKWLLSPTTLDNLALSKFYKAPLLYDLVSEVLFGIIGRKESYIVKEGKKLKKKYFDLIKLTNTPLDDDFKFPLDEYEGLTETVDDGYLDIALLKKASTPRKDSAMSAGKRKGSGLKKRHSKLQEYPLSEDGVTPSPRVESKSTSVTPAATPGPTSDNEHVKTDNDDSSTNSLNDSSTSDEDNDFELGYLDALDNRSNLGPRSKSIFDKSSGVLNFHSTMEDEDEEDGTAEEREKLRTLTLEQLISPHAPVPSDYAIEMIYEMGAITSDMKLMLRAVNAKQMSKILNQWKDDLEDTIGSLQKKYDSQCKAAERERLQSLQADFLSSLTSLNDGYKNTGKNAGKSSSTSQVPTLSRSQESSRAQSLKQVPSSTSLHTLSSTRTDASEKPASSSRGFPKIPGFTPFTSGKKSSMDNNKELDKKITKMIKNDEKMKLKNEKDERLRQAHQLKVEKQRKKHHEKVQQILQQNSQTAATSSSPSSGVTSIQGSFPMHRASTQDSISTSSSSKKGHGILYNLSHPLTRTNTIAADELKMTSTTSASDTNSIDSGASNSKPKKHGLFSLKHKSTKDLSLGNYDNVSIHSEKPNLQSSKSTTSLQSQDSKKSQVTTGSGKKRLNFFSKH